MRLGLSCPPSEEAAALAAGFDYCEFPAASTEPSEATNLFFPADVKLYGSKANGYERGCEIIKSAAARGVQIMVLGSGGVRRAPEDYDIEHAEAVFYDLAADLDQFAKKLGVRVAPESLNPKETNVATSLPEMARALAERGAPYTADSYHGLVEQNRPDADLAFWREQLPFAPLHVHFAPIDRKVPKGDDSTLTSFFARLKELGYDGRATLECGRDGIPDPSELRKLFA